MRNIDALYGRRSMSLSRHEERIAANLDDTSAIAWGDLRDRLAPRDALQGDAVIERLLARSRLMTDLDVRLTPDTALMPARPFTGRSGIRL